MSRWLRRAEPVGLGVGREALGVVVPARGARAEARERWALRAAGAASRDEPIDWADAFERLFAAWPGPRRAALHVTVDDHHCRHWLTTPPMGAQQLGELRALAELRFAEVFRAPSDDWLVAADWSARAPFVCAAMPRALVEALHDAARRHGHAVRSLQPQSVRLLNTRLAQGDARAARSAWVCAFTPGGFTALLLSDGAPADWRQHRCAGPVDAAEVARRLRTQALVADRPMPHELFACGPAPDFSREAGWTVHRAPVPVAADVSEPALALALAAAPEGAAA